MKFISAKNITILQFCSLPRKKVNVVHCHHLQPPFIRLFRIYSLAAFRVRDVDEWTWDGVTKDVTLLHS